MYIIPTYFLTIQYAIMTDVHQIATNVTWQGGDVTRTNRQQLLNQRGATIWFTGLSGSGKSTIAIALEKELFLRKHLCYRLDGDNVRLGINKNLGFSAEHRTENIRRIGEVAKLFVDTGIIALSSFVSPYLVDRNNVRQLHRDAGMEFVEVFVDVPLHIAEQRDPKGLYKKARAGEIKGFTGIDDPYQKPVTAEIHLHTDKTTLQQEIDCIIQYLLTKNIIRNKDEPC